MRWWLVLAVVCVVAGTAAADRVTKGLCQSTRTLPRQGETDVPTNARFWTIPASGGAPDQPIQSYELQPHTASPAGDAACAPPGPSLSSGLTCTSRAAKMYM